MSATSWRAIWPHRTRDEIGPIVPVVFCKCLTRNHGENDRILDDGTINTDADTMRAIEAFNGLQGRNCVYVHRSTPLGAREHRFVDEDAPIGRWAVTPPDVDPCAH